MSFIDIFLYTSAGYALLVALSFMSSTVGFIANTITSYVLLLTCAGYGAVASIVMRLAGHGQSAQWAAGRAFKYTMLVATGITFAIDDPKKSLETVRPAVFIGNHQTELDVLMLGCMFPRHCSVTAKASLKRIPFLGWFMSLSGTVFIDRKNSKDAREAMKGAANEMRTNRKSVYMFPEGTRSYAQEPALLPFKKGAFHLAVEAQVPIIPVVAANYSHILNTKQFIFKRGSIPVKVLDPIPTTGLTSADVDSLTQRTRDAMLEEMIILTNQARREDMIKTHRRISSQQEGLLRGTS